MATPLPGALPPPPSTLPRRPSLMTSRKPAPIVSDEEIRLRLVELAGSPWDKPAHQWQRAIDAMVRYVKTGSWEDPAMTRVDAKAD